MIRLVQPGAGETRDLVIVYHLNASADDDVRAAIGPDACIVNITVPQSDIGVYGSLGGIPTIGDTLSWAEGEASFGFHLGRLVLVGYSAGYIAVRTQLFSGEDPAGIVIADGIQTPRPGSEAAVAPWIAYANRARAGERVFVCSHSTQGQTGLMSTGETLRLITGLALDQAGTLDAPAVSSDGNLVVLSYAGNDHHAQGYTVLPRLLGIAMPLLGGGASTTPSTDWKTPVGIAAVLVTAVLGGVLLARARR